jgi:hypothetical protein
MKNISRLIVRTSKESMFNNLLLHKTMIFFSFFMITEKLLAVTNKKGERRRRRKKKKEKEEETEKEGKGNGKEKVEEEEIE